jgi:hypothetical protein
VGEIVSRWDRPAIHFDRGPEDRSRRNRATPYRSTVLFVDPFAIPAAIVLAYGSRLRALATGLARFRRKSPHFYSGSVWHSESVHLATASTALVPDGGTF